MDDGFIEVNNVEQIPYTELYEIGRKRRGSGFIQIFLKSVGTTLFIYEAVGKTPLTHPAVVANILFKV